MAYLGWGREQRDFPQTILETREKAQIPKRRAPVRVRLPFAFPAFLSCLGWCQVVFGREPEFSGKPVAGCWAWPAGLQGAGKLETGPGPLGARNSQESLEKLWKKIKNPSETQRFLYVVAAAMGGNAFIKPITICGEFALLTAKSGRRLSVRAWAWQLCSHGLTPLLANLCCMNVSTYPRRTNTPMRNKAWPFISLCDYTSFCNHTA